MARAGQVSVTLKSRVVDLADALIAAKQFGYGARAEFIHDSIRHYANYLQGLASTAPLSYDTTRQMILEALAIYDKEGFDAAFRHLSKPATTPPHTGPRNAPKT